MSFRSLAAQRRLSGRIGCVILLLVLASLVDGMITGGFKDPFNIDVLPGQSFSLSEQLPRGAERLEDLALRSSDPRVSVRLVETYSGFWLGGVIWRAEASLPQDIPAGSYSVAMFHQNGTAATPPQAFTLRVHQDAKALQAASGSLVTRTLGLSPYLLAVGLLLLALVSMGVSFLLSGRIAQALRAERMSEIFRSMAAPEGQHIYFCPGQGHGLAPGSLVEVLDEGGAAVVGTAEVAEFLKDDVRAVMQNGVQVRPGTLARLPQTH
ncbi:MAG: hypothetical protein AB9900_13690 [Humidesulfovibrio sp.]